MKTRYLTTYCVAMAIGVALIMVPATRTSAATEQGSSAATPKKSSPADRVEQRIKDLHTKLKITKEQEDLWNKVVQVMRENEKTMMDLRKARSEKAKTMTAVDDLKSYGEIVQAHADGLKKFTPVFEALYDKMSDAQKKNADTLFRTRSTAQKKAPSKGK